MAILNLSQSNVEKLFSVTSERLGVAIWSFAAFTKTL